MMFSQEQVKQIEEKFKAAEKVARGRADALFSIFSCCTPDEDMCLKFLYGHMPLSDLANYDGSLYLSHVRSALKARDMLPWGKTVPSEIFLNYILPYRNRNESIEDFLGVFFEKLYPRVKGLDMYNAVIEVNNFVNECITYRVSDMRTSSPLTVLRNMYGRCSELSTFIVAAMRSVGIPARSAYAPRWVHCDDNHAWTEVWISGNWYYGSGGSMRLDSSWEGVTAERSMLTQSMTYSTIVTMEPITKQFDKYTEVNLTGRYAITERLTVRVTDGGKVVPGANVRFEIINYAELYPLAILKTDEEGEAALITGQGDLYIHIYKDGKFITRKIDVRETTLVEVDLSTACAYETGIYDFEMVPPVGGVPDIPKRPHPEITQEMKDAYAEKVRRANGIRTAYEKTFFTEETAKVYSERYPECREDIAKILVKSCGNHLLITEFLNNEALRFSLHDKVMLLKSLRDKDLTDITEDILVEHLSLALPFKSNFDEEMFASSVLCPRIGFEHITNYRAFIQGYFTDEEKAAFINDPYKIYEYTEKNISDYTGDELLNLQSCPRGTLEIKTADKASKYLLFAAVCRTLGIPARRLGMEGVEYYHNSIWYEIKNGVPGILNANNTATLVLKNLDPENMENWRYVSVGKLNDEGFYQNIHLHGFNEEDENCEPIKDLLQSVIMERYEVKHGNSKTALEFELEPGHYRVLSSNRLIDGTMLARAYYVELKSGEITDVFIELRKSEVKTPVEAVKVNDMDLSTLEGEKVTLSEELKDGYNIVAWIAPSQEPTHHVFNEMMDHRDKYTNFAGSILFIIENTLDMGNQNLRKTIKELPNIRILCSDDKDNIEKIYSDFNIGHRKRPLVLIMDKSMSAVFAAAGYNVGTSDNMLKILQG